MTSVNLNGPFPLTRNGINTHVTYTLPGVYALGDVNQHGVLLVSRAGRADKDVGDRLGDYIGSYSNFCFEYCSATKAAFEAECHLYHTFDPPDNKIHPDRPDRSDWKCPVCWVFG